MRRLALVVVGVGITLASASAPGAAVGASESTAQPEPGCRSRSVRGTAPVGVTPCPGVRPGGFVEITFPDRLNNYNCTFNFVYEGSDGRRYIATAGHCPLHDGERGRFTWRSGKAPIANILVTAERRRVGEFVYAMLDDVSDFALIRLDDGVKARPRMCHFGGPTGSNDDLTAAPTVLHHYGNGVGLGRVGAVTTLPARSALAPRLDDAREVSAFGAIYEMDSGSPVISDDGRAVGVMVGIRPAAPLDGEGPMVITRLGPQIAAAEDALGIDLRLLTAPLS